MYRILVINPGSTSTKIAVYEDEKEVRNETLRHSSDELSPYPTIYAQYDFRKKIILDALAGWGLSPDDFNAVVGRGGLIYPVEGGTYAVNELMLEHLREGVQGEHASNLGGILAKEIAKEGGDIPAFIVDPVVVDELEPVARISGCPLIERRSIFHALNHKAAAREAAKRLGKKYNEVNLIVAHLGGGISVAAHRKGRVIDVNNALDGDGPFAPERSGGLPAGDLVRLCFSGKYSAEEIMNCIRGKGGMVAYIGTNDMREIEKRLAEGEKTAELLFNAMAYQVAKEIALQSAVLEGAVDAIVLSGGLAASQKFIQLVKRRIGFITPLIFIIPEQEMKALALGALRVLRGEEEAKEYKGKERKV